MYSPNSFNICRFIMTVASVIFDRLLFILYLELCSCLYSFVVILIWFINIFLMLFEGLSQIMYVSLLLLYVVLEHVMSTQTDEQPYCSLRYRRLCQGKGRHVACQFPVPGPGLSCQNYTQIKFTKELRHFITHYINRRRQRVASGSERVRGGAHLPRPEIMMFVTWDKELANLAQRLADQCHFVHDDCRATVRYPYAGQSVGEVRWRCSDDLSAVRAVRRVLDAWWGERRRVQPKQLTTPFKLTTRGTVWGHFSQLAVWSLRGIGCAAVTHGRDYTRLLLVCDFSHTNMLGQKTISPGPMAPCPVHTFRKARTAYPLLCVPVKRPIPQETKEEPDKDNYEDETDQQVDDYEDETVYQATRARTSTAPVQKYTESSTTLKTRTLMSRRNSLIGYFVLGNDKKTSRRFMETFEQDLEPNNEELTTITSRKYHHWQTREEQDGGERKWTRDKNKLMKMTFEDEVTRPENYRRRVIAQTEDVSTHAGLRHRWKQTRIRPQRPGANALLNKASEQNWKRPSVVSLMLDQEDVDQLFRDTGFHVHWRQQPLSE